LRSLGIDHLDLALRRCTDQADPLHVPAPNRDLVISA
jgi:hypothetical protein